MVLYSIFILLISNAVTTRRDKSVLYSKKTIIILIYSILILLNSIDNLYLGKGLVLFGGLFYVSSTTQTFNVFIYSLSCLIIGLTGFFPRKVWHPNVTSFSNIVMSKFSYYDTNITGKMGQNFKIIEYPLILLFIISGAIFLISCSDIVSLFLSIELQSYGLYLLCTLYRNSEASTSAGLTYFLLGGLSSTFILLGTSLAYVNFGTTALDGYYVIGNISEFLCNGLNNQVYKPAILDVSFLIMAVGFLFKISAAPFHFWSPDVYDAIPTVVTTFVATIAKISILIFLFSIVRAKLTFSVTYNFNWCFGLILSSLFSLLIGTILGLVQTRIKRLLAFSTISHLGFILLSMVIDSLHSIEAFMFYLLTYTISSLNVFLIIIAIGYSLYTYSYKGSLKENFTRLSDKNYSPIQLIAQIKGYFNENPTLSLSLAITLFSLVGIPPLIGFFAKQMVLSAALAKGYLFLSIVAIITSVISAVYYLAIIKQIFFEPSEYERLKDYQNITYKGVLTYNVYKSESHKVMTFNCYNVTLTSFLSITISILTLCILAFIFEASNLLNIVQVLGLTTINT